MTFFAAVNAPPKPESRKFPVNSLLAGNLASETSSLVTRSSSGESRANLTSSRSKRAAIRFRPAHHLLENYLDAYVTAAGFAQNEKIRSGSGGGSGFRRSNYH